MDDPLTKVQWLVDKGCPVNGRTMLQAVLETELALVEYVGL